jgi:cobalt-zinc-cadmium efflux system outer membrane protein
MNLSRRRDTRKKPILARCLLLGISFIAALDAAAETLDAETAVHRALEQADVRAAERAGIELAASELTAARQWANPELRFERERGRGALSQTEETGVVLAQTWDVSGSRGLGRRAAELGVLAAEADAEAARAAIRVDVLRAFHEAVAGEARAAAARERAAALDGVAKLAMRRTDAGDLSGFEAQRIALVAQRARLERDERDAARKASRERLAAWVGPSARDADLQPGTVALPADASAVDAASNAEQRALQRHVGAAEAAERAALRWRIPISLGIGEKRLDSPGGSDRALLLEATVPLPLFDRNQAAVQRARAEAEQARARLAFADRRRQARLASARLDAHHLVNAASNYRDDLLPQARRLSGIAIRSFAEGEIDLVGLLETLDSEADAVERSIDLQHRAQVALAELESLTSGDTP